MDSGAIPVDSGPFLRIPVIPAGMCGAVRSTELLTKRKAPAPGPQGRSTGLDNPAPPQRFQVRQLPTTAWTRKLFGELDQSKGSGNDSAPNNENNNEMRLDGILGEHLQHSQQNSRNHISTDANGPMSI